MGHVFVKIAGYSHMPIGMVQIYRSLSVRLFLFLFVCKFFVTDISDMDQRIAMKIGRMVDLGG